LPTYLILVCKIAFTSAIYLIPADSTKTCIEFQTLRQSSSWWHHRSILDDLPETLVKSPYHMAWCT